MQHKLHLLYSNTYSIAPDYTRAGIKASFFDLFLRTFMAWKFKKFNIRRPVDTIDLDFMNVVFQSYRPTVPNPI